MDTFLRCILFLVLFPALLVCQVYTSNFTPRQYFYNKQFRRLWLLTGPIDLVNSKLDSRGTWILALQYVQDNIGIEIGRHAYYDSYVLK